MKFLDCHRLPKKVQDNVVAHAFRIMRGVLAGVPGYVVFASAAMLLQSKAKRLPALAECPGDIDLAVNSARSFALIRKRIQAVPGAHVDFEGVPRHIKKERSQLISGYIPVPITLRGRKEILAYPFELFFHSRIIKDRLMKQCEMVNGFRVLTLDGLEEQYLQNLSFEMRVHQAVVATVKRLLRPHNERAIRLELHRLSMQAGAKPTAWFRALMKQLSVDPHELSAFYATVDMARKKKQRGFLSNEAFLSAAAELLAGTKMKIDERKRNVRLLKHVNHQT